MLCYFKMTSFLPRVSSCHNQNQGVLGKIVCNTTGLGLLFSAALNAVFHMLVVEIKSNAQLIDCPVWLVFFCLVILGKAAKHARVGKNVTL